MNTNLGRLTLALLIVSSIDLSSTEVFAQPSRPGYMPNGVRVPGAGLMDMGQFSYRKLKSVAYGNGIFVAVGPGMTILTSRDGSEWVNHSSGISRVVANINFESETYSANGDAITFISLKKGSNGQPNEFSGMPKNPFALRMVAFGGGVFVVVGDSGEILTSTNGEFWVSPDATLGEALTGVVWGQVGFVAVGDNGAIITSTDGLTWTKRSSGTDATLFDVAYGNGKFVAVGDHSTILASDDGIKWEQVDIGPEGMDSIAFGNGVFLAAGVDIDFPGKMYADSRQTMVSTDGKDWHDAKHPYPTLDGQTGAMTSNGSSGGTTSLAFGGALFIATSVEGIFTSKDGNAWNPSVEPRGLKSCYYGAAYGNGTFVAVGNGYATGANRMDHVTRTTIATSQKPDSWKLALTPPSRLLWGSVGRDNNFQIGINRNPFALHLVSTGGETWTTPDKLPISGNVFGNAIVCHAGDSSMFRPQNGIGVIYSTENLVALASKDGIVWTRLGAQNSDLPTPIVAGVSQNTTLSDNGVVINLNGQSYRLNIAARVGQPMQVQASTNLQDWITLTTITNSGEIFNFVDRDVTNYPMRFYRLKLK